MNHTPGPWRVGQPSGYDFLTNEGQRAIMSGTEQEGVRVALVDCHAKYKRGTGWQSKCEIRDANSRLIATAPELLEAAKLVMEYMCDGDDDIPTAERARRDSLLQKAIAKAEGRDAL